jgi:hypothetical protein
MPGHIEAVERNPSEKVLQALTAKFGVTPLSNPTGFLDEAVAGTSRVLEGSGRGRARSPQVIEAYGPQSIAPSEASASAVRSGSQSSSRFRIPNTSFLEVAGTPEGRRTLFVALDHVPKQLSTRLAR